jgi:hypothetical protein
MLITLNVGFWNLEALESGLIGWLVPSGIVLVPACVAWLLPRVGAVLYWLVAVGLALFVLGGSSGLNVLGMLLCACLPLSGLGVAFWFSKKAERIGTTTDCA